jgi:hypothetical protein
MKSAYLINATHYFIAGYARYQNYYSSDGSTNSANSIDYSFSKAFLMNQQPLCFPAISSTVTTLPGLTPVVYSSSLTSSPITT